MILEFLLATALVLGFAIKLWAVFATRASASVNPLFFGLLFVILFHGAWALLSYFNQENGLPLEFLLRGRYVVLLTFGFFFAAYSIYLSTDNNALRYSLIALLGLAGQLTNTLISLTDLVVTGINVLPDRTQALRGELYPLFPAYMLLTNAIAGVSLVVGYFLTDSSTRKTTLWNMMISVSPVVIPTAIMLFTFSRGFAFSLTTVVPLMTTAMVLLLTLNNKEHRVIDVRIYLPFSLERELVSKLIKAVSKFLIRHNTYKQTSDLIERALLLYSLKKNDFVVSQAAIAMGINRTTLYSICRRHNIVFENNDKGDKDS